MTPKEKAKELVMKFILEDICYEDSDGYDHDINMDRDSAKRCALICVDEMLNVLGETVYYKDEKWNYWQEVKKEIELL